MLTDPYWDTQHTDRSLVTILYKCTGMAGMAGMAGMG